HSAVTVLEKGACGAGGSRMLLNCSITPPSGACIPRSESCAKTLRENRTLAKTGRETCFILTPNASRTIAKLRLQRDETCGERIRRLAGVTANPRLGGPCWKCISASRDAAGNLFPHEKLRNPFRTRSPGFSHFPRGRRRTSVRRFCRRLA